MICEHGFDTLCVPAHNILFCKAGGKDKMSGTTTSNRGNEIRFVGTGDYAGYTGWVDTDGNETAQSIAVIVNAYKRKDGSTYNKRTMVRKTSVRPRAQPAPRNRAEDIMQQHPDIEETMEKLARQLAKCELGPRPRSIQAILFTKLQDATARQIALGSKATWKRVQYTSSGNTSD
jgi:hypothetical protein